MEYECLSCGAAKRQTLYRGPIRKGRFGNITDKEHAVLQCTECGLAYLDKFFNIDYEGAGYRSDYNKSPNVENYFEEHDFEQIDRLGLMGLENFRDKDVLDFGTGGGSFCDAICGLAKSVSCVEPNQVFQHDLVARGYKTFVTLDDLKSESFDIITLFGVIEHLINPMEDIEKLVSKLRSGGKIYIETDNLHDILLEYRNKTVDQFYFRTVHNWYFTPLALENVMRKAGCDKITRRYLHKFGLPNLLQWLFSGQPTGNKHKNEISSFVNQAWKEYLVQSEKAEVMLFEGIKL